LKKNHSKLIGYGISLHYLVIFTAVGLTKLSPVVLGTFALPFFQATEKYTLLYYGSKFLLLKS